MVGGQVDQQASNTLSGAVRTELDATAVRRPQPGGHHAQQLERDRRPAGEERPELVDAHHPADDGVEGDDRRHPRCRLVLDRRQLSDQVTRPPQAEHSLGAGCRRGEHLHTTLGDQHDEAAGVPGDEDRFTRPVVPWPPSVQQALPVGHLQPLEERTRARPVRAHAAESATDSDIRAAPAAARAPTRSRVCQRTRPSSDGIREPVGTVGPLEARFVARPWLESHVASSEPTRGGDHAEFDRDVDG